MTRAQLLTFLSDHIHDAVVGVLPDRVEADRAFELAVLGDETELSESVCDSYLATFLCIDAAGFKALRRTLRVPFSEVRRVAASVMRRLNLQEREFAYDHQLWGHGHSLYLELERIREKDGF